MHFIEVQKLNQTQISAPYLSPTLVDTADSAVYTLLRGPCGIGAIPLAPSQSKQQWNPSPAAHPSTQQH